MNPTPSEHAIDAYIAKIDRSASRLDAAHAIRKLFASADKGVPDADGRLCFRAHGILLMVSRGLDIVFDVHAERAGEVLVLPADPRKQSRFVVIEGIDGAGKTTLIANLAQVLAPTTLFLRCNRDTDAGVCARTLIAGKYHDYAVQAAMIADKFMLDRQIRAAREEGRTVVIDRWVQSAFAYAPKLRPWLAQAYAQIDVPTHILWLDVPVGTAVSRVGARGEADAFETKERLSTARTWYAQQSVRATWHTLDALSSEDALTRSALEAIES